MIAEKFRFEKREQRPGESVLSFIVGLSNLATHCQLEARLSDTLRDGLVIGLRNETIQKRLISEADLDLERTSNLAIAIKTATRDTVEVQGIRSETQNQHTFYTS